MALARYLGVMRLPKSKAILCQCFTRMPRRALRVGAMVSMATWSLATSVPAPMKLSISALCRIEPGSSWRNRVRVRIRVGVGVGVGVP